ncbi:MAG: xanthine dehydrogenase accessory protein XdhC [Betaproteobacteria bacterium]|nr:xanthine dehydrogenase accessory protein XdhC [Betaproteobacteria bacterium]NBU48998.1 xanthine dehydrogenase accessory protein XdhC [Betaproteobacteria bacterium]
MNSSALRRRAAQWLAEGRPSVLVQLSAAKGSVPREAGTRMVVALDGALGTIGGGHLEWMAQQTARRLLQGSQPWPAPQRVALGPSLGQCCGGAVELSYQPLSQDSLAAWDLPPPRLRLFLYGAGHVGRALVRVLRDVDVSLDWIDSRDGTFGTEGGPWLEGDDLSLNAEEPSTAPRRGMHCRISEDPAADAAAAPAGAHHVVMTHSHALDFDIVLALLLRRDTGLVGLIGSKTKRGQFEHRLQARGVAADRIADLICPVGLPGVSGKEPAVVAVAVAAQLLSLPLPP